MTATQVNGKKVIATEPVESGLSKPDKPMFFKSSVLLLLEDGSTIYGCVHCDHTEEKLGRLRFHQAYVCEKRPAELYKPKPLKAKVVAERRARREAEDQRVTRKAVVRQAVNSRAAAEEPPPSEVADILSVLSLIPDSNERYEKLEREIAALKKDRDNWKSQYEIVSLSLERIKTMLRQKGLLK